MGLENTIPFYSLLMIEMLSLALLDPSLNASLSKVDPFKTFPDCPSLLILINFSQLHNLIQVFIYLFLGHLLEYKIHEGRHPLEQFVHLGCSGDSLSCLKHNRLLVSWVDSSNSNEFRN